eukprot:3403669-Alexandrium_andersonii.AAC.1
MPRAKRHARRASATTRTRPSAGRPTARLAGLGRGAELARRRARCGRSPPRQSSGAAYELPRHQRWPSVGKLAQ